MDPLDSLEALAESGVKLPVRQRLLLAQRKQRKHQPKPDDNDLQAGVDIIMGALWGKINRTIRQENSPTTVYIFRTADGQALYVGVSMVAAARIRSHKDRCGDFWTKTAHICLEHFLDRRSALNRETQLIAELQPVHNIAKGTIK